jgi:hypothetical protein
LRDLRVRRRRPRGEWIADPLTCVECN